MELVEVVTAEQQVPIVECRLVPGLRSASITTVLECQHFAAFLDIATKKAVRPL